MGGLIALSDTGIPTKLTRIAHATAVLHAHDVKKTGNIMPKGVSNYLRDAEVLHNVTKGEQ